MLELSRDWGWWELWPQHRQEGRLVLPEPHHQGGGRGLRAWALPEVRGHQCLDITIVPFSPTEWDPLPKDGDGESAGL